MKTLLLTRVCLDDFDIFKIWLPYHRPHFSEVACCLFKRPDDDVEDLSKFLEQENVKFSIYENEVFDNPPTLEVLRKLSLESDCEVVANIDCDEFFDDFFALNDALSFCNRTGISVGVRMIDRVQKEEKLYDISECKSYEDLCFLAPISSYITKEQQGWSNIKCALHIKGKVGLIHYPETEEKNIIIDYLKLNHFKWRTTWLKKAKRRYEETTTLKYKWAKGIKIMIEKFEK